MLRDELRGGGASGDDERASASKGSSWWKEMLGLWKVRGRLCGGRRREATAQAAAWGVAARSSGGAGKAALTPSIFFNFYSICPKNQFERDGSYPHPSYKSICKDR